MAHEAAKSDTFYHFDLQRQNREKVREQATAINRTLKQLRKVSSQTALTVVEETTVDPDDEPTGQFITVPSQEEEDMRLKEAYEEATRACAERCSRPAPKSKKRWFGWDD